MADTEAHDPPEHVKEAEDVNGGQSVSNVEESTGGAEDVKPPTPGASKPTSRDTTPALPSPGSGLVPLRGSSGNSATPTLSMPHPKKFSSVNINKRFLEKNSQGSGASHTPATSSVAKVASAIQKPTLQTTASHSRLVTAKLTADTSRSSTTGPGWSRPSSTSSTSAAIPGSGPSVKPTPTPVPSTSGAVPLPTHAGKIIQPQPRSADTLVPLVRKDSSGKPAWRNPITSVSTVGKLDDVQNEFPTAAEVAQVNSAKLIEKKQAAEAAATQKQAMAAEADAFRGVHLGVHHWDEDEGDDSNFLDEVIEFDDGRQYTVKPDSPSQKDPSKPGEPSDKHDVPVSKEERFADDIDRSWPRGRHVNGAPTDRGSQPLLSPSAASSQSLHSPQDSSRVLFNERSNRLEPYSSHGQSRFTGSPREPQLARRGSRSDTAGSPVDFRGGRDAPPHTTGVQLLHKPSANGYATSPLEDGPSRSRLFGDRPGFDPSHDGSRFRDRDMSKRESHAFGNRPPHGSDHNRHNDPSLPSPIGPPDRPRRYSNMGPPPLPPSAQPEGRDSRQLPPHLSGAHPPPSMWRAPSNSERSRRLSTASSVSHVSQTPALSSAPAPALHTPATSHTELPTEQPQTPQTSAVPIMDLEEARKAAMHSAAERAKLRRQQEEEEREKERERARRKAAELEAKLKAAEEKSKPKAPEGPATEPQESKVVSEAAAVALIEDAVRSVVPNGETSHPKAIETTPSMTPSAPKTLFGRPPSARGSLRPVPERRTSALTPAASPAMEAETWRSKVVQPPPQPAPPVKPSPSLPLLEQVDSFSISMDDSVEVVDFSEHGKLIGVTSPEIPQSSVEEPEPAMSRKPARPQAADFFQDGDSHPSQKTSPSAVAADEGSWRRKVSPSQEQAPAVDQTSEKPKLQISPTLYHAAPATPHHKPPHALHDEHDRKPKELGPISISHAHVHPPLKSPYREAPMSALNDTMARIRGALDGMHKPPPNQRWLPPALRRSQHSESHEHHDHFSHHEHEEHEREVFGVTGCEPPRSPKPAWNHFAVRLPHTSTKRDEILPRRLRGFNSYTHVRVDTLSLQPFGNGKRLFQITELLFPRPPPFKGPIEYKVSFPKPYKSKIIENGLVVNLPASARPPKVSPVGAFGRPSGADGVTSWRKPVSSPLKEKDQETTSTLDTVSRSPPPEPAVPLPSASVVSPTSPTVSVPVKSKASKVPNGSGVAFYRDSRAESMNGAPSASVNFIVSSELEGEVPSQSNQAADPIRPSLDTAANVATPAEPKVETIPASASMDLSWPQARETTKEAPTSDAIPDQLRALWTSKSNETSSPSENLLDGLADDVPFTVPDAKLEQPPATIVPSVSRMSSLDVARAFQQVPNSPANHVAPKANGSSSSQQSRQLAGPAAPAGVRSAYPGYPSPMPMMSSPSPTVGYPPAMTPSPVPRPMMAASPYGPPQMWMAVPPPPPPGGPPGMVRSPYGPQLMPYPPGPMPMYPPPPPPPHPHSPHHGHGHGHHHHHHHHSPGGHGGHHHHHHHHPNGMHGRGPPVMMSPVPPPAQAAMYATSPVMMPAQAIPGMPPPGPPYAAHTPGGRPPHQPGMMQQAAPYGSQPSPAYPLPPNSYARTSW